MSHHFTGRYDRTRSVYSNDTRVRDYATRDVKTRKTSKNFTVDAVPAGATLLFQPKAGHDLLFYLEADDAFYRWNHKTEKITCIPSDAHRHNVTGSRQANVTNSAGRQTLLMLDTELENLRNN